jgi:hypothetical protein
MIYLQYIVNKSKEQKPNSYTIRNLLNILSEINYFFIILLNKWN